MKQKLVIITDCDHPSVDIERKSLEIQGFQLKVEQCKTEEDVIQTCKDADGLINQYAPITRKVLSSLPNCKVISRYGVGVDNIDLQSASEYSVQICNVPDYGVEEVSDHALSLIFNVIRKVNIFSNNAKEGVWDFQLARPVHRLRDLTLGVVGVGRIGSAVARKAKGMGWNVIGYDHTNLSSSLDLKFVDFESVLKESDIISIHVPLNDDTYHLFNAKAINMMKDKAVIINTARGPIIDEKALIEALRNGKISGAGLDVMEKEPPEKDHPLFSFDNVIITPHAAWYSEESSIELKQKAADEVRRYLNGEEIHYPVNRVKKRGESLV
ncbi:C-terminal binding protein [Pseudalkalibacillus sp. A8]|uniref:C-terminal binding protein n=1 Tax=Pseudalkalibacillus sp. A8 TaxID=3382641 RepID=UPI0038B69C57